MSKSNAWENALLLLVFNNTDAANIGADRKAREEARALAAQIEQDIRNYDDTIILLLLAA